MVFNLLTICKGQNPGFLRPTNSSFFQFSIRNSQTKFAQRGVCFVLMPLFFSAPFNRLRIHLFFQFSKPIPDFQFSKRSRNHEIIVKKKGFFLTILTSVKNNA